MPQAAGIASYETLANTGLDTLREILEGAGGRYASKDPNQWPVQAAELTKK